MNIGCMQQFAQSAIIIRYDTGMWISSVPLSHSIDIRWFAYVVVGMQPTCQQNKRIYCQQHVRYTM